MASNNPFGGEGAAINRPPLFNGQGYAYWKVRMRIFIQAIDFEIWDAVENGPYIPKLKVNESVTAKPKGTWDENDKKLVGYDLKAQNIITSALSYDEFFRVSQCKSAKEMWDTLQVTHEGTTDVMRARLNTLMHEYELFRMLPNESIADLQKRFTHIVNHLISLGKTFIDGELVNKVLRCLDREWQPKVTAIMESRDLEKMELATLFGKLQEHEMELGRLREHEESDRKKKGISLKVAAEFEKALDDSLLKENSDSEIDEETLGLFVKKFKRFIRKRGNFNKFRSNESRDVGQKGKFSRDNIKCHECGKLGHIKQYCPDLQKRSENDRRRKGNEFKGKKAYIVWDEVDGVEDDATSSSDDAEQANLCLMGMHDDVASSSKDPNQQSDSDEVSSNSSMPSYDQLYDAFSELHDKLIELAKINNNRKKEILKQQEKLAQMQKNIDELELMYETLELIYSNASCVCESKIQDIVDCQKCKNYEKEISDLKRKLACFESQNNLDNLLKNSRNVGNRSGLGFKQTQTNSKLTFHKVGNFDKERFKQNPTYFYCSMFGHTTNICKIKLFDVPSGRLVWIKKEYVAHTNRKGPNLAWVPKSSN